MIKQVIVIRKDLKMRRGKEIAQGAHASISFITRRLQKKKRWWWPFSSNHYKLDLTPSEAAWVEGRFAKICLVVNSENELLDIYSKAKNVGLEVHLIKDAGKTEFAGVPTHTCIAIGPDSPEKIDKITGHLKLY